MCCGRITINRTRSARTRYGTALNIRRRLSFRSGGDSFPDAEPQQFNPESAHASHPVVANPVSNPATYAPRESGPANGSPLAKQIGASRLALRRATEPDAVSIPLVHVHDLVP